MTTMSFAERIKARKLAEEQAKAAASGSPAVKEASTEPTANVPPTTPPPSGEAKPETTPNQPRRFGQPKPTPAPQGEPTAPTTPAASPAPKVSRFGNKVPAQASPAPTAQSSDAAQPKEDASQAVERQPASEPILEVKPLPKVIQTFNSVPQEASATVTEGELLSGKEAPQALDNIREKIMELEDLPDTDLKYEMERLSKMLVENPEACLYLLDEDLGRAVNALRRMTNNKVAVDLGKAKPTAATKTSGKAMTAAEMQSALSLLDDL